MGTASFLLVQTQITRLPPSLPKLVSQKPQSAKTQPGPRAEIDGNDRCKEGPGEQKIDHGGTP